MEPRQCYLFCPAGDRERLFEELDHKTAAPLIPAFRDYVLDTLIQRRELRPLRVLSLREKLDAWVLELQPEDRNVVTVLEEGLHSGAIAIPGASSNTDDGFSQVDGVTSYLNTFGVTVADRIRNQFLPLFDRQRSLCPQRFCRSTTTFKKLLGTPCTTPSWRWQKPSSGTAQASDCLDPRGMWFGQDKNRYNRSGRSP